jgi:cytochrome P450 family 110
VKRGIANAGALLARRLNVAPAANQSPRSTGPLRRPRRPPILAALEMAVDPEGFFERSRARRGDPFLVTMPGVGDVLVSGHPEGARELFTAPVDTFEPLGPNPVEPLLGRHSLILLAGERHRRERKLMTPPFHGERMHAYGTIIQQRTLAEATTFRMGEAVILGRAMRAITLDVILQAVLGVDGERRRASFRLAVGAMLDAYTPPLLVVPALRRVPGPFGPWARFVRARDAAAALLADEIRTRRREGTAQREDILSLLMDARFEGGSALDEGELIDEVRTLIVGGHDTTTAALVWALVHLHRTPDALDALQAELDAVGGLATADQLDKLPYLGAVCNEALRLHPVVPIVPRRALRPFSFRGRPVSPGQTVAVATTLLHRHPEVWTNAASFSPDRFLARRFSPFEHAPFGGGVRRCIGAAFGAYQMRVVLGTLLSVVRFAPFEGREPRRVLMNITMAPAGAVRLRVACVR